MSCLRISQSRLAENSASASREHFLQHSSKSKNVHSSKLFFLCACSHFFPPFLFLYPPGTNCSRSLSARYTSCHMDVGCRRQTQSRQPGQSPTADNSFRAQQQLRSGYKWPKMAALPRPDLLKINKNWVKELGRCHSLTVGQVIQLANCNTSLLAPRQKLAPGQADSYQSLREL